MQRKLKSLVKNHSQLERVVREATNSDIRPSDCSLFDEIVFASLNDDKSQEILDIIWKRLDRWHRNPWRQTYNTLILLLHLLKGGDTVFIPMVKYKQDVIEHLRNLHRSEGGMDMEQNIRDVASDIIELLNDDNALMKERKLFFERNRSMADRINRSTLRPTSSLHLPQTSSNIKRKFSTMSQFRRHSGRHVVNATDYAPPIQSQSIPRFGPPPFIESIREECQPVNAEQEDYQLQIALALSRDDFEAERAKQLEEQEEIEIALQQSETDSLSNISSNAVEKDICNTTGGQNLMDLIDVSMSVAPASAPDPWCSTREQVLVTTADVFDSVSHPSPLNASQRCQQFAYPFQPNKPFPSTSFLAFPTASSPIVSNLTNDVTTTFSKISSSHTISEPTGALITPKAVIGKTDALKASKAMSFHPATGTTNALTVSKVGFPFSDSQSTDAVNTSTVFPPYPISEPSVVVDTSEVVPPYPVNEQTDAAATLEVVPPYPISEPKDAVTTSNSFPPYPVDELANAVGTNASKAFSCSVSELTDAVNTSASISNENIQCQPKVPVSEKNDCNPFSSNTSTVFLDAFNPFLKNIFHQPTVGTSNGSDELNIENNFNPFL